MHSGESNTAAEPRRKAMSKSEPQALYIAESIIARQAEGRTYRLDDYGIANKPDLIELIARALGVIR